MATCKYCAKEFDDSTPEDILVHAPCAITQLEEMEQSFDLRWKADMRAIKMWQEGHPERELTWPDHADMVVWLLTALDESIKLQSHYAILLNMHDGGQRMPFDTLNKWIARLHEIGVLK